ncbi:Serine hydrolase (fragment) [Tenacibaculum litopenaei]|jgi:hypothetical protein|uniref:nuclear transport factor 2 family protein n=1 Tax=Tenacibaculum litopenaei TaxID=396016 RepID=UPI003895383A
MNAIFDFFFKGNFFMKILMLLWLFLCSLFGFSQVSKQSTLYKTLAQKDSLLFERCFNRCELDTLSEIISEDFEFYHDQSGFSDKSTFLASIKKAICSSPAAKPLRSLVPNTLQVYPLYKQGVLYGAIQQGHHEFSIATQKHNTATSRAQFTHLWLLENTTWKLKRVLSFNHIPLQH